jgi:hypothetical protein
MISATECREHAAECRQMADREHTARVQSILIDMARTWERLALEAEHSTARGTPKPRAIALASRDGTVTRKIT